MYDFSGKSPLFKNILLTCELNFTYKSFSPPLSESGEIGGRLFTKPCTIYNSKPSCSSSKHGSHCWKDRNALMWSLAVSELPFMYNCIFPEYTVHVLVCQSTSDVPATYLSIMAHMSMVTLAKLPTWPCSTACKSTSWSSTWMNCMHPWNECWNSEWSESFICMGNPVEWQNKKHY